MSHWAGIESGDDVVPVPRRAPSATRQRVVPRLRRNDRLVTGAIDGGGQVLQRRGRDMLLGAAVLMVPMVGVYVLASLLAYHQFDRWDSLVGDRGYLGVEKGVGMMAVGLQSWTAMLIGAYASVIVVQHQMGGEPTMRHALRSVVRRLPVLVAWWLVLRGVLLALIAVIYLNTDSAAFAGVMVLCSPVIALISAGTLFVAPVVMCESSTGAFGRARTLAGRRFGAAFGYVVANGLMATLLFTVITSLPAMVESTGLIPLGGYGWLAQGVAAQLALLIVMPFSGATTAQLYLQMRMHAEGMDIAMAAERAFGAAT